MQIGTDIVSLKRIKGVFERYSGRLTDKILSNQEKEIYKVIPNERRRLEFLGGRYCAKEAIFKASNLPNLSWKRISILSTNQGRPLILIDEKENSNIKLSISHEEDYATATAIILK